MRNPFGGGVRHRLPQIRLVSIFDPRSTFFGRQNVACDEDGIADEGFRRARSAAAAQEVRRKTAVAVAPFVGGRGTMPGPVRLGSVVVVPLFLFARHCFYNPSDSLAGFLRVGRRIATKRRMVEYGTYGRGPTVSPEEKLLVHVPVSKVLVPPSTYFLLASTK